MSSAEQFKELVRGRLEAAAEEIFVVFQRVIDDYEEELERQRKFFDTVWRPVVRLHRTELPQQVVIKEEVTVEDPVPLNQDKNSIQDQEEPEAPKAAEQQEEKSSHELRPKQEPEDVQLCFERNKSENQSMRWHSEECGVKSVVISSVMSEDNGDLQQGSLSAGVSPTRAQKSTTGLEKPGCESSSPGTLLQHQLVNSAKRPYVCQECGKSFSIKSHLSRHQKIHTGEKPYVCQTCRKSYSTKSRLKSHELVHTGEKPHVCDKCDKTFLRIESLKEHTRIHTGERPYVCDACGKGFVRRSDLILHERMHTGHKPFTCGTCGRKFSKRNLLTTHVRIHTGERPYVCNTCGKGYLSSAALRTHAKKGHGGQSSPCSENDQISSS